MYEQAAAREDAPDKSTSGSRPKNDDDDPDKDEDEDVLKKCKRRTLSLKGRLL